MSKYIIKNCPCRMELHENDCFGHTGYNNCCACTDCVLKQIVELCKHIKSINKTNSYVGEYIEFTQHSPLANEILELLDIQEIE